MIAMAIVGLGLMALINQISQTVSESVYLREKTMASWVAQDRLTELRLKNELPKVDNSNDEMEMAGIEWHYNIKVSATDRDDLRRIDVSVGFASQPETVLASLTGFMAEPSVPLSAGPGGSEFDPDNQAREAGEQSAAEGDPNLSDGQPR